MELPVSEPNERAVAEMIIETCTSNLEKFKVCDSLALRLLPPDPHLYTCARHEPKAEVLPEAS